MKKRGFTLIELLAVIVILAIIALIATPIVMNVIENSKKGAAERSAENYFSAAETAIAAKRLDGPVQDGTYVIQTDGSLCLNDECTEQTQIKVEVNGNIPSSGTIQIQNSIIVKDASNMIIGEYTVVYNVTTNSPKATTKTCILANDLNNDGLGYGDKYVCNVGSGILKTFYVLEDGDNTQLTKGDFSVTHYETDMFGTANDGEVALILDKNYDNTSQSWCASSGNKSCNADGLTDKLNEIREAWTELEDSQIGLPTYAQIYKAAGNKTTKLPEWLKGNLDNDNQTEIPLLYWTATAHSYNNIHNAWYVRYLGDFMRTSVSDQDSNNYIHGVRPVITIPKSELE